MITAIKCKRCGGWLSPDEKRDKKELCKKCQLIMEKLYPKRRQFMKLR